jgi:hypothetical protein
VAGLPRRRMWRGQKGYPVQKKKVRLGLFMKIIFKNG